MGHRLWLTAVAIHRLGVIEIAPSPHHCFRTAHSCEQSVKGSKLETQMQRQLSQIETEINQAVALAELVTYSVEARMDTIVAPVFVLADMAAVYTTWMEQLGTVVTRCVHSRN